MVAATPSLTPWVSHGGYWVKRDDLFTVRGMRGGKVRACLALAQEAEPRGLVTAGSQRSPQAAIVAAVGQELGLPVEVHFPERKTVSAELLAAQARGALLVGHRPGYNGVIIARAREAAEAYGWLNVPFGMESRHAVEQTAKQVAGMPPIERLVVPVGSGMSLAGILTGMQEQGTAVPVLAVAVGADPTARLDKWVPFWRGMADLVPSGFDYHAEAPVCQLGTLVLDPIYEAKCLPFLRAGDGLWDVGIRETFYEAGGPKVGQELAGQLPLFKVGRTLPARSTDPETSHDAQEAVSWRAGSLRARLLRAYGGVGSGGLTDEEAAELAGCSDCGYWKRCSELRDGEYIAPLRTADGVLFTRPGSSGLQNMVCQITDDGAAALRGLS